MPWQRRWKANKNGTVISKELLEDKQAKFSRQPKQSRRRQHLLFNQVVSPVTRVISIGVLLISSQCQSVDVGGMSSTRETSAVTEGAWAI